MQPAPHIPISPSQLTSWSRNLLGQLGSRAGDKRQHSLNRGVPLVFWSKVEALRFIYGALATAGASQLEALREAGRRLRARLGFWKQSRNHPRVWPSDIKETFYSPSSCSWCSRRDTKDPGQVLGSCLQAAHGCRAWSRQHILGIRDSMDEWQIPPNYIVMDVPQTPAPHKPTNGFKLKA